jgi:hypothetical protein
MDTSEELAKFIASSFRSIWALELLLLMKHEARPHSTDELVVSLRASAAVVDKALESLCSAGLAGAEADGFAYMPVTPAIAALVDQTEQLYRSSPHRVRRLIIASSVSGLAAFSDAFRLKD